MHRQGTWGNSMLLESQMEKYCLRVKEEADVLLAAAAAAAQFPHSNSAAH